MDHILEMDIKASWRGQWKLNGQSKHTCLVSYMSKQKLGRAKTAFVLRVEESKAAVHVSGPKYRGFTLPSDYPAGEEDAFGRKDARSRSGLAFYPGKSCSDGLVSTVFLATPEFICGIIADYCVIETPLKKIYVYDSVLQLSGPHEKATKTGGTIDNIR